MVINKGDTNEAIEPLGGSCNVCGRGKDGFIPVVAAAPTEAPEVPHPPPAADQGQQGA